MTFESTADKEEKVDGRTLKKMVCDVLYEYRVCHHIVMDP